MNRPHRHRVFLDLLIADENATVEQLMEEFHCPPTTVGVKGSPIGNWPMTYKKNVLEISSGLDQYEPEFNLHAQKIIEVLEKYRDELLALKGKRGVELRCAMYFSISSEESYPDMVMRPEFLALLGELGIAFSFFPQIRP